jgi:hypothetical protein
VFECAPNGTILEHLHGMSILIMFRLKICYMMLLLYEVIILKYVGK